MAAARRQCNISLLLLLYDASAVDDADHSARV